SPSPTSRRTWDWPIRNSRSRYRVVLNSSERHLAASLLPLLAAVVVTAGCAASAALHRGGDAERRQDYDLAVVEYTKAVQLHPDDLTARAGLQRVKVKASQEHYHRGRRLAAVGKLDEALVEYQTVSELNPTDGDVDQELRSTRNKLRARIIV